jgi:membrane-associated phospholipid phosphatase
VNENINKILRSKKLYFSIALLLIAIALNYVGSRIIYNFFPERIAVPDLLFKITPYIGWTQYWSDIANIFSVILLAIYVFNKSRANKIPWIISTFAIMEIVRGFLIILTPLGGPLGNEMHYGLTTIHQYGAFPSGHFATAMICYYFIDKKTAPILNKFALAGIIAEGVSLILSRGHYSIDIVGGFMISYIIFNEMQKYKEKLTI